MCSSYSGTELRCTGCLEIYTANTSITAILHCRNKNTHLIIFERLEPFRKSNSLRFRFYIRIQCRNPFCNTLCHLQLRNRSVFVEFKLFHTYRTVESTTSGQLSVMIEKVSFTLEINNSRVNGKRSATGRHHYSTVFPRTCRSIAG